MVAEKFQIYSVKITGKYWICSFLVVIESKTHHPGFYHYSPGRKKLPVPPEQHFLKILLLEQKGKGGGGGEHYGVERITKINKGIGHKFW